MDWDAILLHVITAIPPTVAAAAALVAALRAKKETQQVRVTVNGRMDRLQEELDAARRALAQKD